MGSVELEVSKITDEAITLLGWADEVRKLGVRANANTPEEAIKARENGAEGIGLARTERMFLGNDSFHDHVSGNLYGGTGRSLSGPCLQQIKNPFFHSEFYILHVCI